MIMAKKRMWVRFGVAATCLLVSGATARYWSLSAASASDGVTAGEFIIDPPTLINLGFEWFVDGDENRNATVDVSYRKQGTPEWKPGLPMLRLKGERIKQGDQIDVIS